MVHSERAALDPVSVDMESAPSEHAEQQSIDGPSTERTASKRFRNKDAAPEPAWPSYSTLWTGVKFALVMCFFAYFFAAIALNAQRAVPLVVMTLVAVVTLVWQWHTRKMGKDLDDYLVNPCADVIARYPRVFAGVLAVIGLALFTVWVVFDVVRDPARLIPIVGLAFFISVTYALSAHRDAVNWRPVCWGVFMQLLLGFLIMRTGPGFQTFMYIGDKTAAFLEHVNMGAEFVFGPQFTDFLIAFKVLPTIIFFSSFVSVLYHTGILQFIFVQIAWLMQRTMGTSATESLVAAANIFVGQTEAPLLIKPFLSNLTRSEIHAVMTCGFATIAGGVMAAYIGLGVPANHLIAASIMSCPAALAMSKLSYPEVEEPRVVAKSTADVYRAIGEPEGTNVIDAAASGASSAIALVANVAANLIAFLSLLSFVNSVLTAGGELVNVEGLTFEQICSYLLWPIAFIMGVPQEDSHAVARLLGVKTFLNEFVAYLQLSELIADGVLSERATIIATYALCGFSNIGSIGVQLGGLIPMAPERKSDLSQLVVRAMIMGNVACFMTACVAGMFFEPQLLAAAGPM